MTDPVCPYSNSAGEPDMRQPHNLVAAYENRSMKEISFRAYVNYADLPDPVKATSVLPDWWKEMPSRVEDGSGMFYGKGGPNVGTVKRCLPYFDALGAGYILPLWLDMAVDYDANGDAQFFWRQRGDHILMVEDVAGVLSPGLPGKHERYSKTYKINSPWHITTPPGYSCLFLSPIGNPMSPHFELMAGVIDTDKFSETMQFPFVWTSKTWTGMIKKRTPLVQIIPFKRESWRAIIEREGHEELAIGGHAFENQYRNIEWEKKDWQLEAKHDT